MKALSAVAAAGLTLMGLVGPAAAQYWGGGPDGGYRQRGYEYEERRGYRDRGYGFSEREYLRCNPDVLRAVRRGQIASGREHYRIFGRREGRQLSC